MLVAPFDEKEARAARKAWAQYQQIDEERKNSIDMEFVLIPAGRFSMGSPETADELMKVFSYAKKEWFAGERPVAPGDDQPAVLSWQVRGHEGPVQEVRGGHRLQDRRGEGWQRGLGLHDGIRTKHSSSGPISRGATGESTRATNRPW